MLSRATTAVVTRSRTADLGAGWAMPDAAEQPGANLYGAQALLSSR